MIRGGGTVGAGGEAAALRRAPGRSALSAVRERPALVAVVVILAVVIALLIAEGAHDLAQATVNGLVSGSYMALVANVTLGLPLIAGVVCAAAATALIGVGFELSMWRPMRRKGAGTLQLVLMSIGLAFVLRNVIQFSWGTAPKSLSADVTTSVNFVGLAIGRTELIVTLVGYVVLVAVGLLLRYARVGKQMRALSDSVELAETTGIAYGALAGGIVLGLVQEWSTLLIDARWKVAVGFAVLILALIVRPQGIFGRARTL